MASFTKVVEITGVAPWTVRKSRQGGYVASCEVLNLSTEGESWSEITEMTQDVTRLLLESLAKTGELEEFLQNRGFSISTTQHFSFSEGQGRHFDIPSPIFYTPVSLGA
jgi:hypothetical protein